VDHLADQLVYDRLPKRIRRILANAPARFVAAPALEALADGASVRDVETSLLFAIQDYTKAVEFERKAMS
jgi:hypothetical protein